MKEKVARFDKQMKNNLAFTSEYSNYKSDDVKTKKEPKEIPKALQKEFDIFPLDYSLSNLKITDSVFLKEGNYYTLPLVMACKEFDKFPSTVHVASVRLKSLFKILKEYGKIHLIHSSHSHGETYPGRVALKISGKVPKDSIYFVSAEVAELEPAAYPQYAEDVIKDDFTSMLVCWEECRIIFDPSNPKIFELIEKIKDEACLVPGEKDTFIEMITQTPHGLMTQRIRFDFDHEYNLGLHYGKEFPQFHEKLIDRIGSRDKGIVMFHGPPGTGKTFYIRRLLPELSKLDKRVILIPKHVLSNLESPAFNQFMIQNFVGQKIIFIIEDAESIISSRKTDGSGRSELVSTLLNITDGILNDIFNIQVVLTFNTDLKSIDEALLRKGRLIAKYEFSHIDVETAVNLAEHLGVELKEVKESYSLSEIYSLREKEEDEILIEQNLSKSTSSIGF